MASRTAITMTRRAIRKAKAGKWRKSANKNGKFSFPSLALDKPNANELAQKRS